MAIMIYTSVGILTPPLLYLPCFDSFPFPCLIKYLFIFISILHLYAFCIFIKFLLNLVMAFDMANDTYIYSYVCIQ